MEINSINLYNKNGITAEKAEKESGKMTEDNTILIAQLNAAKDYKDEELIMKSALKANKIKQISSLVYQSDDYFYADLLQFNSKVQAHNLKKLTEAQIGIAPKFIDYIEKGSYGMLVTQIKDLKEQHKLMPLSEGYSLLSDEEKHSAYKDVQKLLKMGIINQEMLRGDRAFYVNSANNKIIVPSWEQIRPIDNGEAESILSTIHSTLFRN